MPIVEAKNYTPPFIFKNRHLNTISPTLFRKVNDIQYKRYRINTPDGDFIDFDRTNLNSSSVLIITHGLEGNSQKAYVKGSARAIAQLGIDTVAVNLKGCSEEPNLLLSSYHSGKTDDLKHIVNHCINEFKYQNIYLLGFSLGGNITLKYLGEQSTKIVNRVKAAVAISVPCDLKSSSIQLNKKMNWIYLQRFMRTLKEKAIYKIEKHNYKLISKKRIINARNFYEFDNIFTAPVHGFIDAEDYWEKCSSRHFLDSIAIPTLVINALDDPFLAEKCYPFDAANNNPNLFLETPKYGGHVGFIDHYPFSEQLWHEKRLVNFFKNISGL